jgi:flagellar basal-body rod protein FlgG
MLGSTEITSSGMEALTRQYEAIAHNLANANTTGYKRRLTAFQCLLEAQMQGADPANVLTGEVKGTVTIDHAQGPLTNTGRSLDVAIEGEGFFVIETPEGPLYTRNGSFEVNPQGQLVDASGRTVSGEGGPIVLPGAVGVSRITVSQDGTVWAGGQSVGRLSLVRFENPSVLEPVGQSCFRAPAGAAPGPTANAKVRQFFQEGSNVNVVEELVGLIAVTRLYEANVKAIEKQDEQARNLLQVAMS